jgi:hypothetical protein
MGGCMSWPRAPPTPALRARSWPGADARTPVLLRTRNRAGGQGRQSVGRRADSSAWTGRPWPGQHPTHAVASRPSSATELEVDASCFVRQPILPVALLLRCVSHFDQHHALAPVSRPCSFSQRRPALFSVTRRLRPQEGLPVCSVVLTLLVACVDFARLWTPCRPVAPAWSAPSPIRPQTPSRRALPDTS